MKLNKSLDFAILAVSGTTAKAALELDINRSYLWEIRTGKKKPSKKLKRRLEAYFGTSWDELNSEVV